MRIVKEREHVWVESFQLYFKAIERTSCNYSFDCDRDGNVYPHQFDDPQCGAIRRQSWEKANDRANFCSPIVMDYSHSYAEPAIGECGCGHLVTLGDPMDNQCDFCGRWYNGGGQEVVCPTWDCDESGEPLPYGDF